MKKFHFLAGLPRTGSTVLCALLNQNPHVYVTPTSPLLGLMLHNQDAFHRLEEVKAHPIPEQLTNISRGMINGAWEHRPENIIIDKHRGWGKNMDAASKVFGYDVKIVLTVRDLPSIMASWLSIIKRHPDQIDQCLSRKGLSNTDENRMGEMWFNMTKDCMESVVTAIQTAKSYLLIDYDDFVTDPKCAIQRVVNYLELPEHEYDYENIKAEPSDDLAAWGIPHLHDIRPQIKKTSEHPREVLGDDLYNRFINIEKQYRYR